MVLTSACPSSSCTSFGCAPLDSKLSVFDQSSVYLPTKKIGKNNPLAEEIPEDYKELSFVCIRPDGAYESASTVSIMCRTAQEKIPGLEDFHFHTLRHTFTSNLLSNGAQPKDVQELLGHADVSTTMNIYAHATKEAKRSSARLLDKVVGE